MMAERSPRERRTAAPTAEADVIRNGLKAFAELGYEATTVRELARRIGVSHNYINDRYQSKFGFWKAVMDSAAQRNLDELLTFDGPPCSDEDKLVAAVTTFYRVAARSPEVNRIIAYESVRDSDRLTYLFDEYLKPWWCELAPTIERLIKAGRTPPAPMDVVFFAITGPALALTHDAMAHHFGRRGGADTVAADQLAELVLMGLLPDRRKGHLAP